MPANDGFLLLKGVYFGIPERELQTPYPPMISFRSVIDSQQPSTSVFPSHGEDETDTKKHFTNHERI